MEESIRFEAGVLLFADPLIGPVIANSRDTAIWEVVTAREPEAAWRSAEVVFAQRPYFNAMPRPAPSPLARSSDRGADAGEGARPTTLTRAGVGDAFRAAGLNELEILDEPRRQRAILAVVFLAARPTAGRVQNLLRNAFEFDRDLETEDGIGPEGHSVQFRRKRRME